MNPFNDLSETETTINSRKSANTPLLMMKESKVNSAFPAELNENDRIIFDVLKRLIFQGDSEKLLEKLVEFSDFPIDAQNQADKNYTLLHHAAERKSVNCLQILLVDFSAIPNLQTENGWTPLHLAVISDCRCEHCTTKTLDSLQILIDAGADVDLGDLAGETPLYYAARNRLSQPAEFLLNKGADINHWVNDTSVATLLAQFVPDVLKTEFDECITMHERERMNRGLCLDFRLLLQDVAIHEGFTVKNTSSSRPGKGIFPSGWPRRQLAQGPQGKAEMGRENGEMKGRNRNHNDRKLHPSSVSFLSSSAASVSSTSSLSRKSQPSPAYTPPRETELLNYLLRADLAAIEAVVNHPFVEAFVHLKWLSVRKVFFFFRSIYLFLISLYTFYVFDTFVNPTCFYAPVGNVTLSNGSSISTAGSSTLEEVKISVRDNNGTLEKAVFGWFSPTAPPLVSAGNEESFQKSQQLYSGIGGGGYREWSSFAQYFKAHEMACEPSLRTTVLAYLFGVYAAFTILYELYKIFESWYDYFKSILNYSWWILAINIGISLTPGLGLYAHTWHYPHAAFTLVYGWILVLSPIGRIPFFGIYVGIFVKVLRDFCILLLTFSPVLLAFAFGFSVMLPQNEFFRFIPFGIFKVFLMMTGDVDFWGVFSGTWTSSSELKGHVHYPLFVIYSVYILMVTMVLMSLLLGLAVENIQEVRRQATLNRTVGLIREIGILESILHKPALYYCGFSKYFIRLLSITSLAVMNGPELITFPEDPNDNSLPMDIKHKLLPYMVTSCCCSNSLEEHEEQTANKKGRKNNRKKAVFRRKTQFDVPMPNARVAGTKPTKTNERARREFFEGSYNKTHNLGNESDQGESSTEEASKRQKASRDLMVYKEIKLLLDDNEKLRGRLEALQKRLLIRKT